MNNNGPRGGGGNFRRPWRRFRGGGRGRGRGGAANNNNSPEPSTTSGSGGFGEGCSPPIPPPKVEKRKRKNAKANALINWKRKFPGYRLYYPDSPPQLDEVDKKIGAVNRYLRGVFCKEEDQLPEEDEDRQYFEVSCEKLGENDDFLKDWPTFMEDFLNEPDEVVNLWGAVMHKIVYEGCRKSAGNGKVNLGSLIDDMDESEASQHARKEEEDVELLTGIGKIHVGLLLTNPVTALSKISAEVLGKLVVVRGQIVGVGCIRPTCLQLPFRCKMCRKVFIVDQMSGSYTLPTKCGVSEDCDNRRHFEPCEDLESRVVMDCRKVKLQDSQVKDGIPKTIECELSNALVTQCSTGDIVTITGIAKMAKQSYFSGGQNLHSLFIEVIAIRNHREAERTVGGHLFSFSDIDFFAVRDIHDQENLFKMLVASICPSIYGHEYVKAALLLSLFGGTPQNTDSIISPRSDINVLMIGDPGIGKSQMLKLITDIAPNGVYVCGTGVSNVGLTVALVRDGEDFALEAGALVMADNGVCCIDEFDKMTQQHAALLEAMEQQSVSIAKAGVFRTLAARTTVIAAANPVGGHYDKTKSLNENIKISSPLLSRFDVVFILLDRPNKEFDRRLMDHIVGVKSKVPSSPYTSSQFEHGLGETLLERLKIRPNEELEPIPHRLLRKYIGYAKQYVQPKISPEAAAVLKEYYLKLRLRNRSRDSTPVTTRQLESLLRLTQARAKAELREIATAEDASDILQIFEASLSSAFDESIIAVSALSQSILIGSTQGTGRSRGGRASQMKQLAAALQRCAEQQSKKLFTVEEIKGTIKCLGLTTPADELICGLNNETYLLKKGPRLYQLQTADY